MNWDAVSASAEVIGVIAVLASILYLARQVAQGNQLNHADSVRNFLGQYNTFLYQIGDADMVDIWRRGTTDFESLSDHEKSRLHLVLVGHFMLGQAQRMIDPESKDELSQFSDYIVAVTMRQPGINQWWSTFKLALPDKEYVKKIDEYPVPEEVMWGKTIPWFTPDQFESKK